MSDSKPYKEGIQEYISEIKNADGYVLHRFEIQEKATPSRLTRWNKTTGQCDIFQR